jgi:hypothetical protein
LDEKKIALSENRVNWDDRFKCTKGRKQVLILLMLRKSDIKIPQFSWPTPNLHDLKPSFRWTY